MLGTGLSSSLRNDVKELDLTKYPPSAPSALCHLRVEIGSRDIFPKSECSYCDGDVIEDNVKPKTRVFI